MSRTTELIFKGTNRTAVRSLQEIANQSDKTGRQLKRDGREASGTFHELGRSADRTRSVIGGLAATIGLGGLGLGIKDTVQAGLQWQAQQAQLQIALRNTGRYSGETMNKIMDAAEALSTRGGFGASETLQGMTQFVRLNGNAQDAVTKVTLATNIARSSHRDFTQVLRALLLAEQGRTTGLARLGVAIPKVTTAEDALRRGRFADRVGLERLTAAGVKLTAAQKARYALDRQVTPQMLAQAKAQDQLSTKQQVFALLQQRYGGATRAFSQTTAGQIQNARNTIDIALKETSQRLLPTVAKIATVGASLVLFFIHHKTALAALGITIGVVSGILAAHAVILEITRARTYLLAGAQRLLGVAAGEAAAGEEVATVATIAWGDAMRLTVIGVIITAIVLLVTHFKQVKQIAVGVFNAMKHAVSDAAGWIWTKLKWLGARVKDLFERTPLGGLFGFGSHLARGQVGSALGSVAKGLTFGLLSSGGPVRPRYFDMGGPVGTDTIPGWLTAGEGVVTRRGMAALGSAGLSAINTGQGLGGGAWEVHVTQPAVFKVGDRVLAEAVTRYTLRRAARGPSSLTGGSLLAAPATGA